MLTYDAIAKRIDHSLLGPTLRPLSSKKAASWRSATAWPACASSRARWRWPRRILKGSGVAVGTTIGFPHGGHATAVKVFEARQAMADGATELDMVINIGQAKGGEWDAVASDIAAVTKAAHDWRRDREGDLRELLLERRAEDSPVPDLRRSGRRLREDLDGLRHGGCHASTTCG